MEKEFIRIYNLFKDDVLRLALSYTKRLSDAEDITQNVFIKLYKKLNTFNDDQHIKRWCIKVTLNECKNLHFSSWKRKNINISELNENAIYSLKPNENIIKDVLFELPNKERIIIYLYYYEGYKVKEIAKILNLKESTTQTKLSRAREKLKIKLKGEWEDEE